MLIFFMSNKLSSFTMYNNDELECVLTYCDNATESPNTGNNFNFVWDKNVIPLGDKVTYPCKANHAIEGDYQMKNQAPTEIEVLCGNNGELQYPDPWNQCSETITCADPGNSPEVTRSYVRHDNLEYLSRFNYVCDDKRKWIRLDSEDDAVLLASRNSTCQWKKTFKLDGSKFVCVIHHCRHPFNEPGGFSKPPDANNLNLLERTNWDVAFDTSITFQCDDGMHIENTEIDPSVTQYDVNCINVIGEYDTPVRNSEVWPNCTQTVVCGAPLEPPVNGSIQWLSPALENQQTYNTSVRYYCKDGSQFDTSDGVKRYVDIRCQWNKQWYPYHDELPPCIITECVEPFKIPEESYFEELTAVWTPVNTHKEYRCKGLTNGIHTRFWESDRTKSTFEIFCKPDGYFTWKDWETCIEGYFLRLDLSCKFSYIILDITCTPDAPVIPTDSEYTLDEDDGYVIVNSLEYPSLSRTTDLKLLSTFNNIDIAKNYMANLTYHCGSAREFFDEEGESSPTQSITCQWDKTWSPTSDLGK